MFSCSFNIWAGQRRPAGAEPCWDQRRPWARGFPSHRGAGCVLGWGRAWLQALRDCSVPAGSGPGLGGCRHSPLWHWPDSLQYKAGPAPRAHPVSGGGGGYLNPRAKRGSCPRPTQASSAVPHGGIAHLPSSSGLHPRGPPTSSSLHLQGKGQEQELQSLLPPPPGPKRLPIHREKNKIASRKESPHRVISRMWAPSPPPAIGHAPPSPPHNILQKQHLSLLMQALYYCPPNQQFESICGTSLLQCKVAPLHLLQTGTLPPSPHPTGMCSPGRKTQLSCASR